MQLSCGLALLMGALPSISIAEGGVIVFAAEVPGFAMLLTEVYEVRNHTSLQIALENWMDSSSGVAELI